MSGTRLNYKYVNQFLTEIRLNLIKNKMNYILKLYSVQNIT